MASMRFTALDLIAKRKQRWEELHDIEYDKRIVEAAARKISEDADIAREIRDKPYLLIEIAFVIVDKRKDTVPFFLNEVQRDFIAQYEEHGTGKPYFVLKGRQQGFTSLITAIQLSYAIVRKNFSGNLYSFMGQPAGHLPDTVHTCVRVEIRQVGFPEGAQGKTVRFQHKIRDIDGMIHDLTSFL